MSHHQEPQIRTYVHSTHIENIFEDTQKSKVLSTNAVEKVKSI